MSNPKRILHIVGAMNRGGAETMIMNLYREINRDEYQFDFLEVVKGKSDYAEEISNMGGRIFHIEWSQSPSKILRTIRSIVSVISGNGPFSVVHSHVLFASGTALIGAKLAGVPLRIAHSHSTNTPETSLLSHGYTYVARFPIRLFATDFAACTREAGEFLIGRRGFRKSGVVIPNSVDLDTFFPQPSELIESRIKKVNNVRRLVSVARLEAVKNHYFLIDLAEKLKLNGQRFEMNFVGDGSLRNLLETRVRDRNLEDCIVFHGLRTDIANVLRENDVFLMPSHFEGLPVSLVEAQSTGLRCVVSENVTTEADMGLGLFERVSLDSMDGWITAVLNDESRHPTREEIVKKLSQKGYTVKGSLEKLLAIYQKSSN